jgi:hypothetical protein
VEILRKLGPASRCYTPDACPNLFELTDGNFLGVGRDVTSRAKPLLPRDAGCADYERIILLPRRVIVAAWPQLPAA